MNKSPAFQFYPKDWLDMRVMRMSYEAQGVYMRLLCHIWADTKTQYSIEDDPKMLARILGLSAKKFKKIFAEIQWEGSPILSKVDGFLVSGRLKMEKEKIENISTKRKEAAHAKWSKFDANADANADANGMQVVCSSSSSSLEEVKKENNSYPPHSSSHPNSEEGEVGVGEKIPEKIPERKIPHHARSCPEDFPLELQQIAEGYPEHRIDYAPAMKAHREAVAYREWPGLDAVLQDLMRRAASDDWTREGGRFVPMLSKYIRDRQWLNPISTARASPADHIDDIAARVRERRQQEAQA